jgi:hypothetical protein
MAAGPDIPHLQPASQPSEWKNDAAAAAAASCMWGCAPPTSLPPRSKRDDGHRDPGLSSMTKKSQPYCIVTAPSSRLENPEPTGADPRRPRLDRQEPRRQKHPDSHPPRLPEPHRGWHICTMLCVQPPSPVPSPNGVVDMAAAKGDGSCSQAKPVSTRPCSG